MVATMRANLRGTIANAPPRAKGNPMGTGKVGPEPNRRLRTVQAAYEVQ